MALKLSGTKKPGIVNVARFEHFAPMVDLAVSKIQKIAFGTLKEAYRTWRHLAKELPLSKLHIERLDAW